MPNKQSSLPSFWNGATAGLPFGALRRQIDRIFDDFGRDSALPAVFGSSGAFDFLPNTELQDTGKEVFVRVELPGVDQKNVNISVVEHTIEISGEKKSESERKEGENHHSERSFGSFSRSFTLPFAIDANKVDAKFDNGVLTVRIAKPAEAQTQVKKIAIHG